MKRFEHEVLVFDTRTPKQMAHMKETLREWGLAGFEIVSVTQQHGSSPLTAFLKREIASDDTANDEAA